MRLAMLLWVIVTIAVPCAAVAGPAACKPADPSGGVPPIPDTGAPGAEVHTARIVLDPAKPPYLVRTYSETAPGGQRRSQQCFRYEAVNIDTHQRVIHEFGWPLGALYSDPFPFGQRHRLSNVRILDVLDNPIVVGTRVWAFDNKLGDTTAWADRSAGAEARAEEPGGALATLSVVPLERIDAGLPRLLASMGIPVSPRAAYTFADRARKTAELRDVFTGNGLRLETTATAFREGDSIVFASTIAVTGNAAQEARFFMPALAALEKFQGPIANNLETYRKFIETYRSLQNEGTPFGKGEWHFAAKFSEAGRVRAFRMYHPIMIASREGRTCVLVPALAPIAVTFSLAECRAIGHR
jgi:hypothetical protein